MQDPTDAVPTHQLLRSERFEVVGADGSPRAVLGPLTADGVTFGLGILDPLDGGVRASVAFDAFFGPLVSFFAGGNSVLHIGVFDLKDEAVPPGPTIVLCDRTGDPALRFHVADDGRLTMEPPVL